MRGSLGRRLSRSADTPGSNSGGAVVGWQHYTPWGEFRDGGGAIPTTLNFTGQRRDGTGLLHYGARPYDPALARFVSADTIAPERADPQTRSRYSYVLNNPLKYTDSTGHCADLFPTPEDYQDPTSEQARCFDAATALRAYGMHVAGLGNWIADELEALLQGVLRMAGALRWSPEDFLANIGRMTLARAPGDGNVFAVNDPLGRTITLFDITFAPTDNPLFSAGATLVHELMHQWDFNNHGRLSSDFAAATGGQQSCIFGRFGCTYRPGDATNLPSSGGFVTGGAGQLNEEDFAESVTYMIFAPDTSTQAGNPFSETVRCQYIRQVIFREGNDRCGVAC